MSRRIGFVAGVMAVLSTAASPVLAFQETPVPPPAEQAPSKDEKSLVPPMKLGDPSTAEQQPAAKKRGFGFGLLPKMDFGLDLLYGAPQQKQQLEMQSTPSLERDQDLSVVGKVKRRF